MEERIKAEETEKNLRECHEVQQCEARPRAAWEPVPAGSFNVFLLFNLEAAWDEGHCILALGPVGGPFETYSYYRHSTKLEAPGIMACLRDPMTFAALEQASGWIVHGEPGNWWNEHVNCAIALTCDEVSFNGVRAYAEQRRRYPGTYNLVTYNCLTFCDDALRAGGIRLTALSGRAVRTIIPKDAFKDVDGVRGARPFQAWKYWFSLGEPPANGLRTIQDAPGQDKPLE